MTSRADIVAAARDWLGTPWQHQASLKGVGADCIGLVGGVALACGVPGAREWAADQTCKGYGRRPDPAMLLRSCDTYLERIAVGAAGLGDILVFKFERDPQHFGIKSREGPDYVIHAYAQARRVVENRIDELWRSRILRAYRFRGLTTTDSLTLGVAGAYVGLDFGPVGASPGWMVSGSCVGEALDPPPSKSSDG